MIIGRYQCIVSNQFLNIYLSTYQQIQTFSLQTLSIRNFLITKLNEFLWPLFILKFKSLGLLLAEACGCDEKVSILLDLTNGNKLPLSSISVKKIKNSYAFLVPLTAATYMLFLQFLELRLHVLPSRQ